MTMHDPFEDRYPKTDPWEIIAVMEAGRPYSAAELSESVGMARRTVHKHLRDFFDAGVVDRKSIGPGIAWYIDPSNLAQLSEIAPDGALNGGSPEATVA